ncbi:hypothetical protein TNCV_4486441 [Trichonephila clavipes]|nr:hypothetical protein TNCV_4486441 [Trichonephila clavipes]
MELLPWLSCPPDLSLIETVWFMLAQRLSQDTPPSATDQLWQYVESAETAVSREYIQSLFDSLPRRVAEYRGYTNY